MVTLRIENWRQQRKAETLEKEAANKENPNRKGWTLEDDEEDDAEDVRNTMLTFYCRKNKQGK